MTPQTEAPNPNGGPAHALTAQNGRRGIDLLDSLLPSQTPYARTGDENPDSSTSCSIVGYQRAQRFAILRIDTWSDVTRVTPALYLVEYCASPQPHLISSPCPAALNPHSPLPQSRGSNSSRRRHHGTTVAQRAIDHLAGVWPAKQNSPYDARQSTRSSRVDPV